MRKSLAGTTAILTRPAGHNVALAARLAAFGARVIEVPCIRIEHLADAGELVAAVDACAWDDWLVLTSRAGADAIGRVTRPRCRVATVGESTGERLRSYGIEVAFTPSLATGQCLARELPRAGAALLARSDRAMPDLPRILLERGFGVREVVAYRNVPGASGDVSGARYALESCPSVAVFCSSPTAVEGLVGAIDVELLRRATFFVSGGTTEHAVRQRVGDVPIEFITEEMVDVRRS